MPGKDTSRESHFPSIEKKYGQPMSYWFGQMEEIADRKYPEQIAYLRENHGFSQAHANALVMYSRGSLSTKRYEDLEGYLATTDEIKADTIRKFFEVIQKKYPEVEVVIAWNQPMAKLGKDYLIGISALKNHILLGPWGKDAVKVFADRLGDYTVLKKTIQVPSDWKIDKKLVLDLVAHRVAELG
jgi:uncharacterized protein YdhG (YjbR/CyaY superfamily)